MIRTLFLYGILIQVTWLQVHSTVVLINWKINQEQITQAFCVNKDKPEMNCHGKCHLKTQLEKSASDQKEPLRAPISKFDASKIVNGMPVYFSFSAVAVPGNPITGVYPTGFYVDPDQLNCFHPPEKVA